MDEKDFEGTEVLEKLVAAGKLDAFFEAVDTDNFARAKLLMQQAHLDHETIASVLEMMREQ